MPNMESTKNSPFVNQRLLTSARIFSLATTILLTLIITVLCVSFMVRYEVGSTVSSIENVRYWKENLPSEQQLWFDEAIADLKVSLNENWKKHLARNAIVFLATGIDVEALAAARVILANNRKPQLALSWESFPHLGKLRNSCSGTIICDPLSSARSMFGGVRPMFRVADLDPSVHYRDCNVAANVSHHVKSILQQAQENGLRTGFVTTQRITGAGMAALYAHTLKTAWECDAVLSPAAAAAGCIDMARQLLKSEVGQNLNVAMGGGRQMLVSPAPSSAWDPIDQTVCNSQDNRNLIRDWQKFNVKLKRKFAVLQNSDDLQELNGSNIDYVMGVFANSNLQITKFATMRESRMPKLLDMVNRSLQVLKRRDNGYLLVVESGASSTANMAEKASTLLQLNDVVTQTVKNVSEDETLVLVVFTNGHFESNAVDASDKMNLANSVNGFANEEVDAMDVRLTNILADIMVFAKGPRSFLLHGVHEETYLSYMLSYALQMGHFNQKLATAKKT